MGHGGGGGGGTSFPFNLCQDLFHHIRSSERNQRSVHLIKRKKTFYSYIRKFRMEQLQSHTWLTASSYTVWLNICAFPHILGSPFSYMTLQLLHSEFPYIWGKFHFLFYQCRSLPMLAERWVRVWLVWPRASTSLITHSTIFNLGY